MVCSPMSRLRPLILLLLAALWLPTTLHCGLESAGLLATADTCVDSGDACCDDTACSTVEETLFKDPAPTFKVAAPAAVFLAGLAVVPPFDAILAEPALSPARHAPPPELRVAWQFLSRAAPPARAPSLNR